MKLVILLMNSLIQTLDKLIISMKKTFKKCMISGFVVRLKNRLCKQQLFFVKSFQPMNLTMSIKKLAGDIMEYKVGCLEKILNNNVSFL